VVKKDKRRERKEELSRDEARVCGIAPLQRPPLQGASAQGRGARVARPCEVESCIKNTFAVMKRQTFQPIALHLQEQSSQLLRSRQQHSANTCRLVSSVSLRIALRCLNFSMYSRRSFATSRWPPLTASCRAVLLSSFSAMTSVNV